MSRAPADPAALDPWLFSESAVEPETRAFNERLERALAELPPASELDPKTVRAAREGGQSVFGEIRRLEHAERWEIDGPAGKVPLRVLRPGGAPAGVYLHLHGGGWTIGAEDQQDPLLDALARAANVAVVSVGYRLAPEHPHPAGADDCEAAALWLAEHAQERFGTAHLLIGGESAGAHLSAVTLLRLRDRHALRPFAGANLVYGAYDLTETPSVRSWGERNLVLSTPIIRWFLDHFVPEPERRADPDVSPLYADLAGLPPALFTVGTLDPLLDDTLFMAARWCAAGSPAELALYPGGIHGFNAFPIPLADRANRRAARFLGALAEREG